MSPLTIALWACGGAAFLCWLLSVITREYSWVDRLWSIAPPLYVVYFAVVARDERLAVMAAITLLWGARLTFNFARKGGYAKGGEDYRWAYVKSRMSPWQYQVFNVLFIAGFQNALLLAIALPAWAALTHKKAPFGAADAALAALFLALLAGETVADEQQWRFQRDKKAKKDRGEPVTEGFLTKGLFAWSRHPNFFCEQAMWWVFYAMGARAMGTWLHWTIVGPAVLTALFQGSTNLTEQLSLAKYPSYADYQRRVSRLIPWPPKANT